MGKGSGVGAKDNHVKVDNDAKSNHAKGTAQPRVHDEVTEKIKSLPSEDPKVVQKAPSRSRNFDYLFPAARADWVWEVRSRTSEKKKNLNSSNVRGGGEYSGRTSEKNGSRLLTHQHFCIHAAKLTVKEDSRGNSIA